LDLVLAAAGGRVDSVRAVGRRSVSAQADRAEVDLLFASGCRAHLSASRAHPRSERTLRWWNEDATIELDFFRKTSATLRRRPGVRQVVEPKGMLAPAERERMLAETFAVETREHDQTVHPLRLELDDFIRCARTGARPKVGGEEGLAALSLAHRIEQAMSEQSAGEGSLSRAA
ncbi:MAG TPA: hypothetical protein VNC50_15395, partial [Planctomycetia bacterium]|nr:hypothetical protein [Planctomycetia bacterium]